MDKVVRYKLGLAGTVPTDEANQYEALWQMVVKWLGEQPIKRSPLISGMIKDAITFDPASQNKGIGTRLTNHATDWLREQGMRVAMIGTGGDSGHAPARRTYEKARYTAMPLVRYFKAL